MSNSIKIGPKVEKICTVNISSNTITSGKSQGLYPSTSPVSLSELILKPLTHFNFNGAGESSLGNYVLNVTVLTGSHHAPDSTNAIEFKTVGKNLIIFLNYSIGNDEIESTDYNNYRYQFKFSADATTSLKGKEIIIVTASGDPEEGEVSKVIIEDEDEI